MLSDVKEHIPRIHRTVIGPLDQERTELSLNFQMLGVLIFNCHAMSGILCFLVVYCHLCIS